MHGLGNDFIVTDNRDERISETQAATLAKKLCERRFSIGADGLVLLSNSKIADLRMRIFNPDGSEAQMCGNGLRCFAKYAYENDIVRKSEFSVETGAGVRQVWLIIQKEAVHAVRVDMGVPSWDRSALPMLGEGTCINENLRVGKENYKVTCLSMGNPHCVIFVENVDAFRVERVGPKIENHKVFPERTNVGFAQILSMSELKLRVWERGAGETLACGTGASAAAVAANRLRIASPRVKVYLRGGELQIDVANRVLMNGPAEKVFEGKLFH